MNDDEASSHRNGSSGIVWSDRNAAILLILLSDSWLAEVDFQNTPVALIISDLDQPDVWFNGRSLNYQMSLIRITNLPTDFTANLPDVVVFGPIDLHRSIVGSMDNSNGLNRRLSALTDSENSGFYWRGRHLSSVTTSALCTMMVSNLVFAGKNTISVCFLAPGEGDTAVRSLPLLKWASSQALAADVVNLFSVRADRNGCSSKTGFASSSTTGKLSLSSRFILSVLGRLNPTHFLESLVWCFARDDVLFWMIQSAVYGLTLTDPTTICLGVLITSDPKANQQSCGFNVTHQVSLMRFDVVVKMHGLARSTEVVQPLMTIMY